MSDQSNDPDASRAVAMAGTIRVLVSKLRRRAREAQPGSFTPSQLLALSRLELVEPATVTALAQAEGIRPQSMGANVAVLEAAGLVVRAPDPNDGRQSILSLTPEARDYIKASRAARDDWLSRAIGTRLTKSEQDELARGLELLGRLVDS